jgi:lysophospholipase L1-like esterase
MMVAWALPSFHGRPEIRANIAAALRGQEPERNAARFLYARNAAANRGACHLGSVGYDGTVDPANSVMFPKDWSCTAASLAYVEKFLALADSRGIPVFWALPPMMPEAGAYWASSGTRARYMAMAGSFTARHPGVTLVDATTARYPVEAFNDPVHLNRDGAVVFTADLADVIRSRLATGGGTATALVGLPDYRADKNADRVEDSRATLAKITTALAAPRR